MYPIKTDRHFILNIMSTILDRCNNYTLPRTIFIYAIMAQYIPNVSMNYHNRLSLSTIF